MNYLSMLGLKLNHVSKKGATGRIGFFTRYTITVSSLQAYLKVLKLQNARRVYSVESVSKFKAILSIIFHVA